MSQRLRGALIGCGFVARYHLAAWRRIAEAELVALVDVRPERLNWATALVPGARCYRDAAALLSSEDLDFVEICTRPGSHRELVEQAATAGVHVLCQKPAAETRGDLLAMIDACDCAGVRLMIHENWRFRPWYRALRSDLDAGRIGRPIRLRISHSDSRALRPDGFADQPYFATMPRLILFEMGPHLIDTARYLLGEVTSVTAVLGRFGTGHPGEDLATLALHFATGAQGLLDMTWCGRPGEGRPEWALNPTIVEGTAGSLRLLVDGSLECLTPDGRSERRSVPLPPAEDVYIEGYVAAQLHFLGRLAPGAPPHETSGAATLRTMDVLWAGYQAAESGAVVNLPDP
jgi:predicted dehydrogenase